MANRPDEDRALGRRAVVLLVDLLEGGCVTYDPFEKVEQCHFCRAPFTHRVLYHRPGCPYQAAMEFLGSPEMTARLYEHGGAGRRRLERP